MPKRDIAREQTDEALADLEKRISKLYEQAARDMQDKVDDYFKKFEKRDEEIKGLIGTIVNGKEYTEEDYKQWRLAQIGRGKRFEAMRDALAERMTHANEIAISYANGEIPNIYAINHRHIIEDIREQAGGMIDGIDFNMFDEQTVKRLIVEQPDLLPYYPKEKALKRGFDLEWGKKRITASVTSGLLRGESTGKIARNLMDTIPEMNRTSAVRAVRTAITEAENAGRQAATEELAEKGVIMKKIWLATHDARTRDAHIEADGQEAEIDEPFIVGGEELMFPGDASMGASGWNLYNCRCSRRNKVVGFKSILTEKQRKKANIRVVSG